MSVPQSNLEIEVIIADARWTGALGAPEEAAAASMGALGAVRGGATGVIAAKLTDDAELASLNEAYRAKSGPTNILSFPVGGVFEGCPDPRPLGDLALAFETCAREAEEADVSLRAHFQYLIVHGALHLLGHDHGDADAARVMEAMEEAALARLGLESPYASAAPRTAAGDEAPAGERMP